MISPSISARRMTGIPRAPGRGDLRVRLADRRGDHEQVRSVHVRGVVAECHPRSELLQSGDRVLDCGQVAAGDLQGRRQEQDLRDAAHAHAARADEVDPESRRNLTEWTSMEDKPAALGGARAAERLRPLASIWISDPACRRAR
jgi:hypothetical protein